MDIEKKARHSAALLDNEHFIATLHNLREEQKTLFANTGAEEVERREECHAILRALNAIQNSLQADVDALEILMKQRD